MLRRPPWGPLLLQDISKEQLPSKLMYLLKAEWTIKKKKKQQQIFKLVYSHITVHFLMKSFDWYCYYCLQFYKDKWVLPEMVIVLFLNCYTALKHWVAMDIPIALRTALVVSLTCFCFFFLWHTALYIHFTYLLVDTGQIPLGATIVLSISFFKALKSSINNSELPHQYFAEEVAWIVTGK